MFWRWWKIVRGALIFTAFYLSGAFFGWFFLPLWSLTTRDPLVRMRRNQIAVATCFRVTLDLLRWARIFTYNPRLVDPQLPGRPVIVVSNHPTTIDVVAVLAVYRDASVVVKHKIWNDRFLQRLFRYCGHIDGGDGSMASNQLLLANVQARLAQGFNVVIFPEGTRSPPRGLGTMFKGAFAVASTTQTDILPVLVTSDPPALHKDAPWHVLPDHPVDYRVRPRPLISSRGASAKKLQRQVVDMYRAELGLPAQERDLPRDVAAS
ncbi:MAG: lysophospholipid acyltransferase family protein [Myxococcales bacterium]